MLYILGYTKLPVYALLFDNMDAVAQTKTNELQYCKFEDSMYDLCISDALIIELVISIDHYQPLFLVSVSVISE